MKKTTKRIVIGIAILVVLVALFGVIYSKFSAKPTDGVKNITIEVVDKKNRTTSYTLTTEAEFLRQAMDELKDEGLTYKGKEDDIYGIMFTHVNGVKADYEKDGAYWSIYVNGEYGKYGADLQPIADGDTYTLKYEVFEQ